MVDQVIDEEREYLRQLHRHTLGILGVYERQLGVRLTTADMRFWIRHRGPDEDTIIRQVEYLRRCEAEDST